MVFQVSCSADDGTGAATGAFQSSTTSTTSNGSDTGSGPDVDELGDGAHEVRIVELDLTVGSVTLDGLTVMEGMEAVLAYLGDTGGAQLEGPQIYVRNAVVDPRDFPVDAAGSFSVIAEDACCEPVDVGWSGLAAAVDADFDGVWGNNPPFLAVIEDGQVVSLEQIHIP